MSKLRFPGDKVLELIEGAKRSEKHYMTLQQRFDRFGVDAPVPGEEDHAPAALWLVKDEGIYLLSNSYPRREGPLYASGFGPKADWHAVREAAGGDDFVEVIELDGSLEKALRGAGHLELEIDLTETALDMSVIEIIALQPGPSGLAEREV